MAKRMALGKGADALLRNINGTNTAIDEAVDKNIDDNTNKKAGELMVKISLVEPNRNQPRKMFDIGKTVWSIAAYYSEKNRKQI